MSYVATLRAVAWCEFLEQHARKLYASELAPGMPSARALVAKIQAGDVADGDTPRSICRHGWSRLTTTAMVDTALSVLEECGWLRLETVGTEAGRTAEIVRINPAVAGAKKPRAVAA